MFYKHTKKVSFLLTWQSKMCKNRSILSLVRLFSTVKTNMVMLTVIVPHKLTSYWKTREETLERSKFSSLLSLLFLFPFLSFLSSSFIFLVFFVFFFFLEKELTSCHLLYRFKKHSSTPSSHGLKAGCKPGLVWVKGRVHSDHLHTTVSGWMNSVCLISNPLEHQRSNSHFRVSRVTFHLKEDEYCLNCSQQAPCLTAFTPFSLLKWHANKHKFCHIL